MIESVSLPRGTVDPESLIGSAPAAFEDLAIGAYACDAAGRIRWFNARAAEIWGRTPEIGEDGDRYCGSFKVFDLGGALLRREESPMAHVLRTGEPVTGSEALVERPDGSRIVAMVHVSPVRDPHGVLIGAINCFHDVGERIDEKRALVERERQFRDILQALPAAIYTTDAAGRITFYNEAAVELSGRRPEIGSDSWCVSWKLLTADGAPLAHDACPMAISLKEGRTVRGGEAIAERPDGARIPFTPYPTPLYDENGALIGAVNMLVDIREQKKAEARQKGLVAELNHRVKNNMQTLHGLLRLAGRAAAGEEARAALASAAARVGAIGAAHTALYQSGHETSFEAAALLKAVANAASSSFEIDARVVCDDGIMLGNDAASPLALILNELIANAASHGTNGAARVALCRDGAAGLALTVEDDGPGFDYAPERAGFGLQLVEGLAAQLGGAFAVERGAGTKCIVRFPAQKPVS